MSPLRGLGKLGKETPPNIKFSSHVSWQPERCTTRSSARQPRALYNSHQPLSRNPRSILVHRNNNGLAAQADSVLAHSSVTLAQGARLWRSHQNIAEFHNVLGCAQVVKKQARVNPVVPIVNVQGARFSRPFLQHPLCTACFQKHRT